MLNLTDAQTAYVKSLHDIVDPVDIKNAPHKASIKASEAEIAANETPESKVARRELQRLEMGLNARPMHRPVHAAPSPAPKLAAPAGTAAH